MKKLCFFTALWVFLLEKEKLQCKRKLKSGDFAQ